MPPVLLLIFAFLLAGAQTGTSARAPPARAAPVQRAWQFNASMLHTADVLVRARLAAASAQRAGVVVSPDELAYVAVHSVSVNWTAVALQAGQPQAPHARTGVTCTITSGALVPGATGISVSVSGTPGSTPTSPRTFLLSLPTTLATAGGSFPTLLVLHGGMQYAADFLSHTGFDTQGIADGYIVLAPNGLPGVLGLGGTWPLLNQAGDGSGDAGAQDDRTFVADCLDCVNQLLQGLTPSASLSGDVYAAGWSIGAKFAARLACGGSANAPALRSPYTVRALALSAGLQADPGSQCLNGGKPVPVVAFACPTDLIVPFCTSAVVVFGSAAYHATRPEFDLWRSSYNGAPSHMDETCSTDDIVALFSSGQGDSTTALVWWPASVTSAYGGHDWPMSLSGCGSATAVSMRLFGNVRTGTSTPLCGSMSACGASPPTPCSAVDAIWPYSGTNP